MKPKYENGNVRAKCPDCNGAVTTFEHNYSGRPLGIVEKKLEHKVDGREYNEVKYLLLRCAGCGRGGVSQIHFSRHNSFPAVIKEFFPLSKITTDLPRGVPEDIENEYREAELCASVGAYRASSAMVRSVLEKILKKHGYNEKDLFKKIEAASTDGILTESRKKRAHEEVRVLGNDVLHDEWREISESEVSDILHYTQRILEDFYDDRESVEDILKDKGRLKEEEEQL